jgi:hypothetical protein
MRPLLERPIGCRPDAADENQPMHCPERFAMIGHELVGALFTTPKDLRHQAEQELGQLFVPTEVLYKSPSRLIASLRVQGVGLLVVHAERQRHWQPFHITRVERRRAERSYVARRPLLRPATGCRVAAERASTRA